MKETKIQLADHTPKRTVFARGRLPATCYCGNPAVAIDKIGPACARCRELERQQLKIVGASPRRSRAEIAKAA